MDHPEYVLGCPLSNIISPYTLPQGFAVSYYRDKDMPRCIGKLVRNKVYIVTCFCICCEMFVIIGFAGFLPKYLETEYQASKAQASMIAGELWCFCNVECTLIFLSVRALWHVWTPGLSYP
ncbi:unnamed protein product [Dibothriocephalus latus]|uniref:Uncharacterized protein n=1 Tax=Dibothriocephalus latus TaxID=60516 RepID=A0A3P6TD04_DIBLA|nr:unnamed protein product [Dibothriocephalus latus]